MTTYVFSSILVYRKVHRAEGATAYLLFDLVLVDAVLRRSVIFAV